MRVILEIELAFDLAVNYLLASSHLAVIFTRRN